MTLNHLCVKIGSINSKSQSGDDNNCQAQFQLTSLVPVELIWQISQDMATFSSRPNLGIIQLDNLGSKEENGDITAPGP